MSEQAKEVGSRLPVAGYRLPVSNNLGKNTKPQAPGTTPLMAKDQKVKTITPCQWANFLPTAHCLLPTFWLLTLLPILGCKAQATTADSKKIVLGAEQLDLILPQVQGKRVGLLV